MTNSDNGPVDARTVVSQLDATDGVILDMLEKDGRATLSHLSEATGLSVSAVQSRVQKLERRGVIRGYKAVIDDERRGLAVNAYIAVTPITPRKPRFQTSSKTSTASCPAIPSPVRPASCSPFASNRPASSKSC